MPSPHYAELHCLSNFSFLRGASFPEELLERAVALGYFALAITDECSLAGVVRAHTALRRLTEPGAAPPLKLIIGSEFSCDDGLHLVLLARSRRAYAQISELISRARRHSPKGQYLLTRDMLLQASLDQCLVLYVPDRQAAQLTAASSQSSGDSALPEPGYEIVHETGSEALVFLKRLFQDRLWITVQLRRDGRDNDCLQRLQALSLALDVPLCASGGITMHTPGRRPVRDTLTAIRLGKTLHELGFSLPANGEQALRSRQLLARLYPAELLEETLHIARQCDFSLAELRYEYPHELVPADHTPQSWLRVLTLEGMKKRWPQGVSEKVKTLVERELALIAELSYEHFFLTVHDIVVFARSRNILCQGRGSAANSAVCYCLGITAVDPQRMQLLFERFLSRERDEPPDIDVDFEHERREEVIQYIYRKYGRHRAALAATVICYRRRSAVRDVGKALGLAPEAIDELVKTLRFGEDGALGKVPDVAGVTDKVMQRLCYLVQRMMGFPRHLSQHVGGFVISQGPLSELVPVENASMAERTVIQWEKDDLEALGLLKVDVLALGMLTAIRKALDLINTHTGSALSLSSVPAEDPAVYDMISAADTVGTFQIESRAQMSMLPRLRPRNYYDLVIQIAIVRPGPIQGDMVHPYLARRQGLQSVSYPSNEVRTVLERTLGVPIFQEQVMQIAMLAAGFTGGEADQLRRAMAAWKRKGGLEPFRAKLVNGMLARGYSEEFALQVYQQIRGFGDYGFPESHSASFALLAYVSAWLKKHHPVAFCCALLNSQPMGFYAPAQLVQDLRRHQHQVLPVDVNSSDEDCTLEYLPGSVKPALRLGLRMVKGLSCTAMTRIMKQRQSRRFASIEDVVRRTALNKKDRECLASADAFSSLAGDRYRAFWQASGVEDVPLLFAGRDGSDRLFAEEDRVREEDQHSTDVPAYDNEDGSEVMLPKPGEAANILADYAATGLTLRRHPLALLRDYLSSQRILCSSDLSSLPDRTPVRVAGIVTCRQRPQTARGVCFITLEDEAGFMNVVVWPQLNARQPRLVAETGLMAVEGKLQSSNGVVHVVAERLADLSSRLGELATSSRDFR